MEVTKEVKEVLLHFAKNKKIYLEGNILKVLKSNGDIEFQKYLDTCKEKDTTARKKRLQVTKQVQSQNKELEAAAKENERVNKQLTKALEEASKSAEEARSAEKEAMIAKAEAEKLRDEAQQGMGKALEDLELMQKKTQFELIGKIVTVALWVILGVGMITTCLFGYTLITGQENPILESTWSNLFGILLTNSFSIIGTIMGVKYATEKE